MPAAEGRRVITLVLGGARSGKSAVAEHRAGRLAPPVTFVATMLLPDTVPDPELMARIDAHRRRRPEAWTTVEAAGRDVVELLDELEGTVLLDALGPLVAAAPQMRVDGPALCRALRQRPGDTVVVSEEVGLGVHPSSAVGRMFRDELGALNQEVAAAADEVLFVMAGRVLRLDDPTP